MDRSQRGLGRQQGTTRALSVRPKGGPRPPFGDAPAPKTGPELPQEGPGAKLTKSPPKLIKFGLIFVVNLGQVFDNLGGERELQRWAMNDGL